MENNIDVVSLDDMTLSLRDFISKVNTMNFHIQGLGSEVEGLNVVAEELRANLSVLKYIVGSTSAELEKTVLGMDESLPQNKVAEIIDGGGSPGTDAEDADKLRKEELEKEKKNLKERMEFLKKGAAEHNTLSVELKKKELEELMLLGKKEAETQEQFEERQFLKKQELTNARIELAQSYMNAIGDSFSGMSKMFGAFEKLYADDAKNNADALRKQKNMQIAGATMEMLSGVVKAVSGAMTMGPILGPIMGTINSAAVIAAGVANIKKIKSTDTSGSSAASTTPSAMPSVSAPLIEPEIETVYNLTTSSEQAHHEAMMQDQKVYILSSDLEANGKRAEIRDQETTF